jgi:carbamoyl-phosphate synthase small subunit
MTGYQEIVTDPSYAEQFILFTASEIGVVGVNEDDMESDSVFAMGAFVCNYTEDYSNFRAKGSLSNLLIKNDKIGICNIDTRFLTKMLRENGSMMMVASTEIKNRDELKKILDNSPRIEEINYIKDVSTDKSYIHISGAWNHENRNYNSSLKNSKKILAIDFGVKRNILNELTEAGLCVEVIPYDFNVDEIIDRYKKEEISGVFLSNGPGDPLILVDEKKKISKLIESNIPMFGICLGHQMLSIANGFDTYKLRFGHHGGNHPVSSGEDNRVEITSQNHNYNVPNDITQIADVMYKNLFDDTIEGLEYKNKNIFSVQFHPESSPGPHDSKSIFTIYANKI